MPGSRDFAVLFVEAACNLGFGARIVSGYLYKPDQDVVGTAGAGPAHAWAEVRAGSPHWRVTKAPRRGRQAKRRNPVAKQ